MNGRKLTLLLPLVCAALALAATQPLDAQLGGFGRRITEGVKKATGTEEAKPAPEKPVAVPANNPAVIPITDKVLEGYARSVQTEIDLRNQLRNELIAREEGVAKHKACEQQAAGSPESQKIVMQLVNAPENATSDQMTALMAKMGKEQQELILKMCGTEPGPINVADRLTDIRAKAAASAGPIR